MQVSVEAGEGLERRMTVDLPFEQITQEVDKRLQQLARTVRLPGFRPGKAPMKILRQRFAERVHLDVFGEMVQSSFTEALTQESLHPVGSPKIEPEMDLDAERFSFTAIFEVMPEFELASLSGRSLKRPVCELAEADVDAMIERLREQRKTWTPTERPCQSGDQVTLTYQGTLNGEPFEGGAGSDIKLELGSGEMIPGFEDGLIGASVGETRTLELTFPDPYQTAHLAGQPVRFEVTLQAITEPVLPLIDAEFVKAFGVEDGDLERFRADVQANMARELKDRLAARIKESVMDLLFEANPLELPQALVKSEIQDMAERVAQSLGDAKMILPDALFETGAKRRVALGLILGRMIKDHDLNVDAAQIREMVEQLASTYDEPQAVLDYYYSDRKRLALIESSLLEQQAVDLVMGQLATEDEVISFAELTSPAANP